MMTYKNLKRGGKLTEGVPMTTQALTNSMKSITVWEYGNATSVSELALQASFTDEMANAVTALSRDMALTVDCEVREVAMVGGAGTSKIYGRADKNAAKISSRAEIDTSNVFSVATTNDAVEVLATNNVPKIDGSYYVCMLHPHVARGLRDDSAWVNVQNYATPENMLTGEIGKINDVRFIETTLMPNGAMPTDDDGYSATMAALVDAGVGGIDVYQSIVMGEGYIGMAIGLPIELRDNGVEDFGRKHSLAWYSIFGVGILQPTYAVIVETA
jgi:N4-gp56 family major capsid protein